MVQVRRHSWWRWLAVGAVASLVLVGCGDDDDGDEDASSDESAAPETTEAEEIEAATNCADIETPEGGAVNQGAVVHMIDFEFCTVDIAVDAGQAITFVNDGAARHQVAHDPPGEQERDFRSEPLLPGDEFVQTFDTPGTYPIICSFHFDEMMGTVTVS